MVQLAQSDIKTTEVLDWQGIHLFHFAASSCSQKSRIYLNLKGLDWTSHEVSLAKNENFSDWYLGINPRGLLPTLVLDGQVHIESNDILVTLESAYPTPVLIPADQAEDLNRALRHEDDLHMDLRTLTFRYTQKRPAVPKSADALAAYRAGGSGQVAGQADAQRGREIDFWERVASEGITDDAVRTSASRFRDAFDGLERQLGQAPYLAGENMTVLDIAWYVYASRLQLCGYPLARLHPAVGQWYARLNANDALAREVKPAAHIAESVAQNHVEQAAAGKSLVQVTGY